MFGKRWRILRLAGIPISIDLSWLVILALITWTMAEQFRDMVKGLTTGSYWGLGLITALAFFVCLLLHELGHSLVARATGIPIRGITLFLFGGVSEMEGEPPSPGKEFFMAIAGPLVSAILAAISWIVWAIGRNADWPAEWLAVLFYLGWINTAVLVFNIIPAFPMDGGRVLRSILWAVTGNLRRATHWASVGGQVFAWFLIALALLSFFSGAPGGIIQGIWLGLIGLFLNNAARSSYQQVLIKEALQGEPVSRFMNTQPIVVPPDLDLRHWVEDYVYRYHRKMFPVASNGHLEGVITTRALDRYPREEWDAHRVQEVMRQDFRPVSISPTSDALHALEKMQRTGFSRLLVTQGDHLVGIISLKDLLGFLQMKMDLEPSSND